MLCQNALLFLIDAPILVYFHGGYWQYLSLELSAHLAKGFYEKGVIVASIGYDPCPKGNHLVLGDVLKTKS